MMYRSAASLMLSVTSPRLACISVSERARETKSLVLLTSGYGCGKAGDAYERLVV